MQRNQTHYGKDTREIDIKLRAAGAAIKRLKQDSQYSNADRKALVEECEEWLKHACSALRDSPTHRKLFALDSAYACLHNVRHKLCELLPIDQLHTLAQEISFDLPYIRDEAERSSVREGLKNTIATLNGITASAPSGDAHISEPALRRGLIRNSLIVANHREAVWHKVNLMRTRLLTTLAVLSGLLVVSMFLVPYFIAAIGDIELHWYKLWALTLFGAMGGALSALLTQEPLNLPIAQYYLKQTMLYLRPAIGAAAGLVIGLLQLSEVISILPGGNGEIKLPIALIVAFLSGFSERLFLGRFDKLLGREAEKQSGEAGAGPVLPS